MCRLLGLLLATVALLAACQVETVVVKVPAAPGALAQAQQGCQFVAGFAALRTLVGAATVGECLENERFNPASGDTEQRTTGGLLIWHKAGNWTAFTDGATTWINGPYGLQSRPNAGPPFSWEASAASVSASP